MIPNIFMYSNNFIYFRGIIFHNFRYAIPQQQSMDELNSILGNETLLRTGDYQWDDEFNLGSSSLQDEGRPKSVNVTQT